MGEISKGKHTWEERGKGEYPQALESVGTKANQWAELKCWGLNLGMGMGNSFFAEARGEDGADHIEP